MKKAELAFKKAGNSARGDGKNSKSGAASVTFETRRTRENEASCMWDNGVDFVDFKKLAGRVFSRHLTGTFPNKKGDVGKKGILESSDRSQSNVPKKKPATESTKSREVKSVLGHFLPFFVLSCLTSSS